MFAIFVEKTTVEIIKICKFLFKTGEIRKLRGDLGNVIFSLKLSENIQNKKKRIEYRRKKEMS